MSLRPWGNLPLPPLCGSGPSHQDSLICSSGCSGPSHQDSLICASGCSGPSHQDSLICASGCSGPSHQDSLICASGWRRSLAQNPIHKISAGTFYPNLFMTIHYILCFLQAHFSQIYTRRQKMLLLRPVSHPSDPVLFLFI